MALILAAGRAWLQEDWRRALGQYERAVELAQQPEFPHHAALALERRGRILSDLHRWTEARSALSASATRYRAWGAIRKASALEREQRDLGASR